MTPDVCPQCGKPMRFVSSVYPVYHCGLCGTLAHGLGEQLDVIKPRIVEQFRELSRLPAQQKRR